MRVMLMFINLNVVFRSTSPACESGLRPLFLQPDAPARGLPWRASLVRRVA